MRRLYLKITLFLLPLFLVWASLEVFYRQGPNTYSYKNEQLQKLYKETETVVFGDSHSFFGINPLYFESRTFNISNISQSLLLDELLLAKHIANLPSLKTVILNVSYFTLSAKQDDIENSWRKYFYHHNMEVTAPSISIWNPKRYSMALIQRFNKSMELVDAYCQAGTIITTTPLGYGLQDASSIINDKEAISKVIAKKHENYSLDFALNTVRLERMVKLCRLYDVDVVLLEMPVYPAYYKLLNPVKKQKIKTTLRQLSKTHDNAFYLDLSTNSFFDKKDLRDADHLNNAGAQKCSELLNKYINNTLQ